jgi:cholesterol oxidase
MDGPGGGERFDTVVIGSGFGGSVVAYRLAAAGQRVCVLERGRAYPPGSFPRTPAEVAAAFWDPSAGMQGLFDVWSFRGIESVVSSGLGGGSLIYANVLLRKDERWFVHEQPFGSGYETWPVSRADLDPHYDEVERMLGAQRFPAAFPGYDATPKTVAVQEAAGRLGLDWELPNLAVSFANPGAPPRPSEPLVTPPYGNLHGLPRTTCRLCGECDIGCNDGAKNTLDHTYLSAAHHHGADIRTRAEVRRIAAVAGGYEVGYVEHRPEAEGRRTATRRLPEVTLAADRVVLAAGTFGSTYLLLRNRGGLPGLSPALGTRFSGNGDLLGFMLRSSRGSGRARAPRALDPSRGPVITTAIRVPDEVDGGDGRGYYVEDAGYPAFLSWMVEASQVPGTARRALRFAARRVLARLTGDPRSDLGGELSALLGDAALSSTSLPLLGMGRDVPDGTMRLRGRKAWLDLDWTTKTSEAYFRRVRSTMADLSRELGADFHENPLSLLRRVITVHPLGGTPMGRHPGEGVVDAWGEAFDQPDLYVVDGSAMPGPTGANPSLTIAAFADRVADGILAGRSGRDGRARGVAAGSAAPAPPVAVGSAPPTAPAAGATPGSRAATTVTTLAFTEEMKGHVTLGERDFAAGAGGAERAFCMFHLTITVTDVERFVHDRDHVGRAEGWVECDALGGRRPVEDGVFNLFVDSGEPGRVWMRYRLPFTDAGGNPLTLVGFKDVHDDPGLDLWRDTSTLYTRVLAGHVEPAGDEHAPVVAAGVITIWLRDFAHQLTTFRVTGPDAATRARAFAAFGRLFLGTLWDLYAPAASAAAAVEVAG